jgi:hypothetical protein
MSWFESRATPLHRGAYRAAGNGWPRVVTLRRQRISWSRTAPRPGGERDAEAHAFPARRVDEELHGVLSLGEHQCQSGQYAPLRAQKMGPTCATCPVWARIHDDPTRTSAWSRSDLNVTSRDRRSDGYPADSAVIGSPAGRRLKLLLAARPGASRAKSALTDLGPGEIHVPHNRDSRVRRICRP